VPVDAGGHDSVTLATPAGTEIDGKAVPGGTWKESFSRFTSVAVTVQSAADATGNTAIPPDTSSAHVAARTTGAEYRRAPDRHR
jgi:hypothetical protein